MKKIVLIISICIFSKTKTTGLHRRLSLSIESPVEMNLSVEVSASLEELAPASSTAAQARHTLSSPSLQCHSSGKNLQILCLGDARRCSTNFTAFCLQLSAESYMLATTKPV